MCEICKQSPCHPRCPNHKDEKPRHYCSSCGDGIYFGEEYIKNDNNEYRHYDCFFGMRELLEWLGYKIETMEEQM